MWDRLKEKLQILADAAKYDVSCASSGSNRKNTSNGIGDTGSGICHSYTEDGRCVSLLKILLTNHCIYDCAFCVSRRSNDVKRAAFTVEEVVSLTMNFYRRNYIEGLFLSSGIFKNADYTMERMLRIVKKLRLEENYNGYIHLKTIPGASEDMLTEAGLYADRMSINLEMPTEAGLKALAPEKSHQEVKRELGLIRSKSVELADERKVIKRAPRFVPAGQSTQMVVGATPETDMEVMYTADQYYRDFGLKRVYYSGYIPISHDSRMPAIGSTPPVIRENRLYQTDWLVRFYGFEVREILHERHPNLDPEIDPKLGWALQNPSFFPVDVNTAPYRSVLRIPGVGVGSAKKIMAARRFGKLRAYQLKKMGIAFNRAQHFMRYADSPFQLNEKDPAAIRQTIMESSRSKFRVSSGHQLSLF